MTLLRSPLFWLSWAGFLLLIGFFLRRGNTQTWGFRDVIKNPEFWYAIEDAHRQAEQAEVEAQSWTPEQIERAVRHFVLDVPTSREGWTERRILLSLGEKTHPGIFRILGDTSLGAKLTIPTGKDLVPEAPINRLCDLLCDHPSAKFVPALSRYIDDDSDEVRKSVAISLGSVGSADIIAPLRKALSDPDEYVRSYAMMGLQRAVDGRRLDHSCARALFSDFEKLLLNNDTNAREAASLLISFDREKAVEFLLSSSVLAADSESLHGVLEAISQKEILVSRTRLLELIRELEKKPMEYPRNYAMGEALRMLGRYKAPEDCPLFEQRMEDADETVAAGAAAGMLASHELEKFDEKLWRDGSDPARLRVPARYYRAVMDFNGEVNNGGLSQYFVNSSGNDWPDALSGLEAMGFKERSAILREAITKFGPEGPSQQRDRRQDQLASLAKKDSALFDSLDERYYNCAEKLSVFASRYMLRNADAFR